MYPLAEGVGAIDVVRGRLPDVIVMELAVPGADGFDLGRFTGRSAHFQYSRGRGDITPKLSIPSAHARQVLDWCRKSQPA